MDLSALAIVLSVLIGVGGGVAVGLWFGKSQQKTLSARAEAAEQRAAALDAQLELLSGQYDDVQKRYAEDQKCSPCWSPCETS